MILSLLGLKKYLNLDHINLNSILRLNYFWFSESDKYEIYSKEFTDLMNKDYDINEYLINFFQKHKDINQNEKFIFFFQKLHLKALLSRLDYISMNNSVEARCPFLDHRLVEAISKIPFDYKIRWRSITHKILGSFKPSSFNSDKNFISKYLLRSLAKNLIPIKIRKKKKIGFPTPLDLWFSKNLKSQAKEILLDKSFLSKNIFDQKKLLSLIENKKNYPYDFWGKQIWLLINLSIWFNTLKNL